MQLSAVSYQPSAKPGFLASLGMTSLRTRNDNSEKPRNDNSEELGITILVGWPTANDGFYRLTTVFKERLQQFGAAAC
jgi:hypothetical protein